jgi:autotransporter-associated beta strand protein
MSSVVQGSGNLAKSGTGTLTLAGNNTYSGATTINAGTLQISSTGLLGGGIYSGNISNSGTFLFASNSNQTIAGTISGAGAITKNGTSTLAGNMTGGSMGQITVNGGTLRLNNTAALNTANILTLGSMTTINNGSTLEFDASSSEGRVKFAGGVTFGASGNNTLAYNTFNGNGGSLLIQGSYTFTTLGGTTNYITTNAGAYMNMQGTAGRYVIFDVADGTDATDLAVSMAVLDGGIRKSGAGVLTLSADNTGINNLDITNGTLELAGSGWLNSGTFSVDITNNGTLHYNGSNAQTLSGNISGTGTLAKSHTSTLTLSGNNSYSGGTTISAGTLQIAGTGLLGGGSYSGNIANSGALIAGSNSNQILSGIISGTGALTKNGSGTLTLSGSNTYSGGTTLNTGTLVIGNAAAAGAGTITQASSSSLLKIDTTGTIANNMSVYNVLASQSATLSGVITVNNATWDIDTGDTLTISGAVSGNGGVTKNGDGTLILSGSNSYASATTVNAGTLEAAHANALGGNTTVQVNGGSLLVTADDALNGKNITLASTANGSAAAAGLAFTGTYNGTAGSLTLSENSTIDLGTGSVALHFSDMVMGFNKTLAIYNWTGTTLWGGGNGDNIDQIYFGGDNLTSNELNRISFYSSLTSSSFLGTAFQLSGGSFNQEIIPVPEPETYAVAVILLLGFGIYALRRSPQAQHSV